jgi:hypothetical protein
MNELGKNFELFVKAIGRTKTKTKSKSKQKNKNKNKNIHQTKREKMCEKLRSET